MFENIAANDIIITYIIYPINLSHTQYNIIMKNE